MALGPLARPRPLALAVHGLRVVAEVVLIAAGSGALAAAGRSDLRPALVATVVGLHVIPFAEAFGERMSVALGAAVAALGAAGLLVTVALHAGGRFVRPAVPGSAP